MSTRSYDLRDLAENYAQWNEDFVIDVNAEDLLKPNVVLLFEILDYSPAMILEDSPLLNADNMFPIAWAFLRPIGAAHQHLSDSKLQLYHYRGRHSSQRRYKLETDLRTPDVLLELNWPMKKKYNSHLIVNLSYHGKESHKIYTHFSRFPWETEVGIKEFRLRDPKKIKIKGLKEKLKELEPEERIKHFKWERTRNEPCKRPDKFIMKLDTEDLGSFRIKFSNDGSSLAAGCTLMNS